MATLCQHIGTILGQAATAEGRRQINEARRVGNQVVLAGDGFILEPEDPYADAHRRIANLIQERLTQRESAYETMKLTDTVTGQQLRMLSPANLLYHLRATLIRAVVLDAKVRYFEDTAQSDAVRWNPHMRRGWEKIGPPRAVIVQLLKALLHRNLPHTQDDLLAFGTWILATRDDTVAQPTPLALSIWSYPIAGIVKALSMYLQNRDAELEMRNLFQQLAAKLSRQRARETSRYGAKIEALVGSGDRMENHPMPLTDIPPLVFSEVLRDVDLFVGVASVGNDPNWSDGGPEGRYVDYWRGYAFGALGTSAQTRKMMLERLIPRLQIAERCSFIDRFLVVRGDIRTYKIHLGSGNILMEPNDAYLCIVAKQGKAKDSDKVFLPFEGDSMTSIILSKAFLLASDRTIKDATITSQLKR